MGVGVGMGICISSMPDGWRSAAQGRTGRGRDLASPLVAADRLGNDGPASPLLPLHLATTALGFRCAATWSLQGVRQSTNEVVMVAPTAFGFNEQAAQVRAVDACVCLCVRARARARTWACTYLTLPHVHQHHAHPPSCAHAAA